MDEAWLVEECRKGNSKAQEMLYKHFAPRMMGVCIRYASDRDVARDVLQEGFVKIFAHLKDYRASGSFEGWMRRIFIHCALERLRQERLPTESSEPFPEREDAFPSALEEMAADELLQLVRSLPEGYRTIFNLFAIEGFSHKEIGEMLHISEGTSRSQYARARQTLQQMIGKIYS